MPRKDLEKAREDSRKWYRKNAKKHGEYVRAKRKEIKAWFDEYKATLKCSKCPESHIATLDFHHRDPKEKDRSIAEFSTRGWCKERILKEIAKCDVLCANCHRKLHWNTVKMVS